jgi:uncharacterized membrane protein
MLFIAYDANHNTVWHALKLHIEFDNSIVIPCISDGVNVLISDSIKSYASIISTKKAGIEINETDNIVDKLKKFSANTEYATRVYDDYFSKKRHIQSYKKLID